MTRMFAAFAVTLLIASPALADGPTRASEINVELVTLTTRARAEALYPQMSRREIDLLMHRICEQHSLAMLEL